MTRKEKIEYTLKLFHQLDVQIERHIKDFENSDLSEFATNGDILRVMAGVAAVLGCAGTTLEILRDGE